MTKTLHGTAHGKTIELDEDLGVPEGQDVEVQVMVVPSVTPPMAEGLAQVYTVLSERFNSGVTDVAARHNEDQQAVPELPAGDPFFDMLKGIWAARTQAGLTPRSVEEVEAQRRRLRDEADQEITEAGRLQEECRRLREEAEASAGGRE